MTIETGIAVSALALALVSALGCAANVAPTVEPVSPRVFVGTVSDSDARVGIIATATRARVYFCGGDTSYTSLTRWLTADIDSAERASLKPATSDDWGLDFVLGTHDVSGMLDAGAAKPYAFHATEVVPGTNAGLYEATAPCGKVGLIVVQPSKTASALGQGACIESGTANVEQVNPLSPIARTTDGALRVTLAGSSDEIVVRTAIAPQ
jgi:hypothetical protein